MDLYCSASRRVAEGYAIFLLRSGGDDDDST